MSKPWYKFRTAFFIFFLPLLPKSCTAAMEMDAPLPLYLHRCSWRTLEAKYDFHPFSSGQLFSPRLYNGSGFRMQHVPSHLRSAVSLDSVWFISICIISSALYISFRHQRFSLVTVLCHLSFTCLLSEFDLIPLVYFKRLISYPHSALFHCDFSGLCIFYLEVPYCDIYFIPRDKLPSSMILKKVINLTSRV